MAAIIQDSGTDCEVPSIMAWFDRRSLLAGSITVYNSWTGLAYVRLNLHGVPCRSQCNPCSAVGSNPHIAMAMDHYSIRRAGDVAVDNLPLTGLAMGGRGATRQGGGGCALVQRICEALYFQVSAASSNPSCPAAVVLVETG
jgi:hypothetical protein